MKILQIINNLGGGGAEKLLVEMSILLVQKGHDVEVVLLNNQNDRHSRLLTNSNIPITYLGSDKYSFSYISKIRSIIKCGKYDVVHSHLFPTQYYVSIALFLLKNKPKLITTEHSTYNRRHSLPFLKPIESFIYSNCDRIVCISDSAKKTLIKHLRTTKNICVVNNGVNIKDFLNAKPSSDSIFNKDKTYITMVARFDTAKNHKAVIDALSFLNENFNILFVGEGPLKEKIESYVVESNLNSRIKFLGFRNDIPALLKASDFVVLSSHWEGLSLSSVEGLASGKPFLASNVNGLKEVVGGAGILFENGDSRQLANEIIKLTVDKEYRNSIVKACLSRAKEYDIDLMVENYLRIYSNEKKNN